MWEVFNYKTGKTLFRTRFEFLAVLLIYFNKRLDYAREGCGW